jgi:hypothetical protein
LTPGREALSPLRKVRVSLIARSHCGRPEARFARQ